MKINPFDKLRVDTEQSRSINPTIFKAYDIRGIYPDEINEGAAYLIGRAFVKFLGKKIPKIIVGFDNRLSSQVLKKYLVKGVLDQGANIIDIGLSTTPMFYFAVAHYNFDGGIIVTASHLPKEYNGFKLVREKAIPISEKTGLKEIHNVTKQGLVTLAKKGAILKKKVLKDYLKFNLKDFKARDFRKLKIVIDTANSVSGIVVTEIFKKTPFKIFHLFKKLDGSFPNHAPDPLKKENLRFLESKVKNQKANLGVAFDGDGDRVIFIDEKDEIISGDLITALMAKILLKNHSSEKILYDIRSSNIVKEMISEKGGTPIPFRIGHSFIKEKMRKENIFFAGEFSGHYYSRAHYFCECPFFVLFSVLKEISQTKKNLSQLITPLKKYYHSGEINFEIPNKEKFLEILERKYKKGGPLISKIDGLRVDFSDWWFNTRPSQTEPVLRLVLEAKTKKLLEEKKKELSSLIKKIRN